MKAPLQEFSGLAPSRKASAGPANTTPMMQQYFEIKAANPDVLLFFRMGDFYELFFHDAEQASRALGIALTKRGKHQGDDIPMCGVPAHSADEYLHKLIALGFRVAVCEQLEDPREAKKRGPKSVVKRDVVRLVTAGTLTEEALLEPGAANYFAALARTGGDGDTGQYGVAWVDISTGEFRVALAGRDTLGAALARIEPREVIAARALIDDPRLQRLWEDLDTTITVQPDAVFDSSLADKHIHAFYGIESIDTLEDFSRAELAATAGAIRYIERTQIGARPALNLPRRETQRTVLAIDAASRRNLELGRTLSGERRGAFLHAIDRTVSAAGARTLGAHLASPLTHVPAINARLDCVQWLVANERIHETVRACLKQAPDMSRALARLSLDRGGPRDLGGILRGIGVARELVHLFDDNSGTMPAPVVAMKTDLCAIDGTLHDTLKAALADDLPPSRRDAGFVRDGYRADLDEARTLRDESRRVIASLQAKYAAMTRIKSIKVRHNNVLGYFVETGTAHGETLMGPPANETFIHRQTLANAIRFSTLELGELESKIASASDRAAAIEAQVFENLAALVMDRSAAVKRAARALAALDVSASHAALAREQNYCRPVVDDSLAFDIRGGRHAVVEQAQNAPDGKPFVANDCDLGPPANSQKGCIWLVTGPNMAGKSTFLRQNALIAILAQMGGYVPAASAHIGVVDQVFSRVGAADDLARGRSTFMVEMIETAAILNRAGARAFVILDEIGRGTATYDGLSIAWATIEHLHQTNRCRALFATHYHEMTALAKKLRRLKNVTVSVREWKGEVVFLHEIVPGAADRSYGIQVARLAGLPAPVIARAGQVLAQLENTERQPASQLIDDLPLFAAPAAAPQAPARDSRCLETLRTINPDELSPRDALSVLYELKKQYLEDREPS